jgi:hypothetical protein
MTKTRNISDLGAFTPSGAGGVQRTVENKLRDVVSVKDFGAVGDGVADDTAAIQAAINSSVVAQVYFPKGTYRVTTCLNFTNGWRALIGEDTIGTRILSESTTYIVDCSGSNWTRIENLQLVSATAKVGLYYNRTTDPNGTTTFRNIVRNVNIEVGVVGTPSPAINGGIGRVAVYMRSLELSLFDNVTFVADTCVMAVKSVNATFPPIYGVEGGVDTATCTEFQKCVFFSQKTDLHAVRLLGTATTSFYSCYVGSFNYATDAAAVPAFLVDTGDGLHFQSHIEFYKQALKVTDLLQSSYVDWYMAYASDKGTILLDNGNARIVSVIGSFIRVKTGDVPSINNVAVKAPNQSTANLYLNSTTITAVGGCQTPFASTNSPVSSDCNFLISQTEIKLGQTFFGASIQHNPPNGNILIGTYSSSGNAFAATAAKGLCLDVNTSQILAAGNANPCGYFNRTASNGALFVFNRNGLAVGQIDVSTTGTTYGSISDYRLKENVKPLANAVSRLQQLKPSRFNFISDPDKEVDGFLAHEIQTIVPECATGSKDAVDTDGNPAYQSIDQAKLVPLLTAALQEAVQRIETLESQITSFS